MSEVVRQRIRTILRRMLLKDACFYGSQSPRMTLAEWSEAQRFLPISAEAPRGEGLIYYVGGCCTRWEASRAVELGILTAEEAAGIRTRTHELDWLGYPCQKAAGCPRKHSESTRETHRETPASTPGPRLGSPVEANE